MKMARPHLLIVLSLCFSLALGCKQKKSSQTRTPPVADKSGDAEGEEENTFEDIASDTKDAFSDYLNDRGDAPPANDQEIIMDSIANSVGNTDESEFVDAMQSTGMEFAQAEMQNNTNTEENEDEGESEGEDTTTDQLALGLGVTGGAVMMLMAVPAGLAYMKLRSQQAEIQQELDELKKTNETNTKNAAEIEKAKSDLEEIATQRAAADEAYRTADTDVKKASALVQKHKALDPNATKAAAFTAEIEILQQDINRAKSVDKAAIEGMVEQRFAGENLFKRQAASQAFADALDKKNPTKFLDVTTILSMGITTDTKEAQALADAHFLQKRSTTFSIDSANPDIFFESVITYSEEFKRKVGWSPSEIANFEGRVRRSPAGADFFNDSEFRNFISSLAEPKRLEFLNALQVQHTSTGSILKKTEMETNWETFKNSLSVDEQTKLGTFFEPGKSNSFKTPLETFEQTLNNRYGLTMDEWDAIGGRNMTAIHSNIRTQVRNNAVKTLHQEYRDSLLPEYTKAYKNVQGSILNDIVNDDNKILTYINSIKTRDAVLKQNNLDMLDQLVYKGKTDVYYDIIKKPDGFYYYTDLADPDKKLIKVPANPGNNSERVIEDKIIKTADLDNYIQLRQDLKQVVEVDRASSGKVEKMDSKLESLKVLNNQSKAGTLDVFDDFIKPTVTNLGNFQDSSTGKLISIAEAEQKFAASGSSITESELAEYKKVYSDLGLDPTKQYSKTDLKTTKFRLSANLAIIARTNQINAETQFNSKVSEIQDEIDRLKAELPAMETKLTDVRSELNKLGLDQQKLTQLKAEESAKVQIFEDAKTKVQGLESERARLDAEIKGYEAKQASLDPTSSKNGVISEEIKSKYDVTTKTELEAKFESIKGLKNLAGAAGIFGVIGGAVVIGAVAGTHAQNQKKYELTSSGGCEEDENRSCAVEKVYKKLYQLEIEYIKVRESSRARR